MLAIERLTKTYAQTRALSDFTLRVEAGEVVGLLGPNGAGKTTLVRLLMGFLFPTSGNAKIAGFDCARQSLQVRQRVGYVPGNVRLFGRMRVRDVLRFLTEVRRGSAPVDAEGIARSMGLPSKRRVAFLSTGMRQKLALAAVFHADVPVLILDEPTANLDPTVRAEVLQRVRAARNEGRTVLFSSHVLSEIEDVCDRVVFVKAGQLVHVQNVDELRSLHRIRMRGHQPLPDLPGNLQDQVTLREDNSSFTTLEASGSLTPLLAWLASVSPDELSVEPMRLQAVYDRYFHNATADQA